MSNSCQTFIFFYPTNIFRNGWPVGICCFFWLQGGTKNIVERVHVLIRCQHHRVPFTGSEDMRRHYIQKSRQRRANSSRDSRPRDRAAMTPSPGETEKRLLMSIGIVRVNWYVKVKLLFLYEALFLFSHLAVAVIQSGLQWFETRVIKEEKVVSANIHSSSLQTSGNEPRLFLLGVGIS